MFYVILYPLYKYYFILYYCVCFVFFSYIDAVKRFKWIRLEFTFDVLLIRSDDCAVKCGIYYSIYYIYAVAKTFIELEITLKQNCLEFVLMLFTKGVQLWPISSNDYDVNCEVHVHVSANDAIDWINIFGNIWNRTD